MTGHVSTELSAPPPANLLVEVEVDSIDPQVTGRRFGGSFTIAEWCKHRRVSISMYYKLRAQGKAPATLPVGRHQTITAEADAAWARERQAEATTEETA
jgi:hypothetical protein